MSLDEIFELERKNVEQKMAMDVARARFENRQHCINAGINIICVQMTINTLALMCGALRDR